jgi:hypothetical protein
MARRLPLDGRTKWGDEHLQSCVDWSRELFTHHTEHVSASAALIVDGLFPVSELARLVIVGFNLTTSY